MNYRLGLALHEQSEELAIQKVSEALRRWDETLTERLVSCSTPNFSPHFKCVCCLV